MRQVLDLSLQAIERCGLTPRSSGRAHHKVPSPSRGARAAQLNR
jgi:hypothetical protein